MFDPRLVLVLGALSAIAYFVRQSAGRLAPRIAIAPIVFLTTRWPVMAAWVLGTMGWLVLLSAGMREKGLDTPQNLAIALGIALLCGGGVAVMVVGPTFFVARLFVRPPELPLEDGETVILRRPANHFLGGEARGGVLLVTTRRLAFRPHRFNVQLATWSMPLDTLDRVEREGLRLLIVHPRDGGAPAWLVAPETAKLAAALERVARAPEAERASALVG